MADPLSSEGAKPSLQQAEIDVMLFPQRRAYTAEGEIQL